MGNLEPDAELRNPDWLAHLFLPPVYSLAPRLPWLARLGNRLSGRLLPGGYQFETARTMHMDSLMRSQLHTGVDQVVILGAGYDTRAYRFAPLLAGCTVFEVDMPAIQRRKQALLAARDVEAPPQLVHVAANRDYRDLFGDLIPAGYDPLQRSLFIWSGVTMYLREAFFAMTLKAIHRYSAVGSLVVFDYFSAKAVLGAGNEYGARQAVRRVRKIGEPFAHGMERDEVGDYVRRCGFRLVSNLSPKELERSYLTTGDRSLGRPFGFASIAEAEVCADHLSATPEGRHRDRSPVG